MGSRFIMIEYLEYQREGQPGEIAPGHVALRLGFVERFVASLETGARASVNGGLRVDSPGSMTIAIILVASVDSQLEAELLDAGGEYSHLHGLPKALLPITGGKRILDYWWCAIEGQRQISDVYLVTNARPRRATRN